MKQNVLSNRSLANKFGFLGLLAILFTLPFAVPAFWDVLQQRWGAQPGSFLYLTKPVENQHWYLLFGTAVVGVPWAAWMVFSPVRRPLSGIIPWTILALLAVQIVSASISASPGFTYRMLMLPAAFVLGFIGIICTGVTTRGIEKLLFLLLLTSIPLALYAIAQNQGFEILPYSRTVEGGTEELGAKQRIASTFGHPNYMASYLVPLLFWSLYFILRRRTGTIRWIAIIAGCCIILALLVGGTRGPWLSAIVAAVPFYILLTFSPLYKRQLLFAAGMGLFLTVLLLFIPNPFLRVQFDLSKRILGSTEIASRFYYWLMAIEMFKSHPLAGIGYFNFDAFFWDYVEAYQQKPQSEYYRFVLQETIRGVHPGFVHNDHLQILAESGLAGCGLWLLLWSTFLTQAWTAARRLRHNQPALLMAATFLASCTAVAVDGLTNFPIHIPVSGFLFYVLLGLWVLFYRERFEHKSEPVLTDTPSPPRAVEQVLRGVPRISGTPR